MVVNMFKQLCGELYDVFSDCRVQKYLIKTFLSSKRQFCIKNLLKTFIQSFTLIIIYKCMFANLSGTLHASESKEFY